MRMENSNPEATLGQRARWRRQWGRNGARRMTTPMQLRTDVISPQNLVVYLSNKSPKKLFQRDIEI